MTVPVLGRILLQDNDATSLALELQSLKEAGNGAANLVFENALLD